MCGIVGIVSKQPNGLFQLHTDYFKDMLVANSARGMDSTGVFGVTCNGEVELAKQAAEPHIFLRSSESKRFLNQMPNYRLVIGHNRKATTGEISSKNAHPFKEGHIVLVHNGMVYDHKALNSEVDVDSHALCHSFAEKGAIETIKGVRGAFALVWYDLKEKALFLWRNDERPLAIMERSQELLIASEEKMLDWIVSRENRSSGSKFQNVREVPSDSLMKISFKPFNIETQPLRERPIQLHLPSNHVDVHSDRSSVFDQEMIENIRANQSPVANEEESTDVKGWGHKDVLQMYPMESRVLFDVGSIETFLEDQEKKQWLISGTLWLPSRPPFHALCYTNSGLTHNDLKAIKEARTVETTVERLIRTKVNKWVFHVGPLKVIKNHLTTFNKYRLLPLEWASIVETKKCVKCQKFLNIEKPDHSSVNPHKTLLGVYKTVCNNCVLESLKADQKDALLARSTPAV